MGKTPKPLRMLVDKSLLALPEIKRLQEKGHEILSWSPGDVDLILSPLAWYMTPQLAKYIEPAIKRARVGKYPTKGKGVADASKD